MPQLRRVSLTLVAASTLVACSDGTIAEPPPTASSPSTATRASTTTATTAPTSGGTIPSTITTSSTTTAVTTTTTTTTTGLPAPVTSPPPDGEHIESWRADLAALDAALRRIHPDPFWRQPEAAFADALARAPARLTTLDAATAAAEVMKLVAGIDGHSGVYPFKVGFHVADLHLYDFGGSIHVVNAVDPELIGAEVVEIGDVAMADAITEVRPYAAHDNEETIRAVTPMLLATPEVLVAAGVIASVDRLSYEVVRADGTAARVTPELLTWDEFATRLGGVPVGLPKSPGIPSLARRDEPFWSERLLDGSVYAQYNAVVASSGDTTLRAFADQLASQLDEGAPRLILDMRHNSGGNNRTYGPLESLLTSHPALAERGRLVILIGRQTFSAAVNFATEIEAATDAVFVGEPTGGRPNLFGDVRTFELPNSAIPVEISSRYWEFGGPGDSRPAIDPDIVAPWTIEAFVAGRDPVLETALGVGMAG